MTKYQLFSILYTSLIFLCIEKALTGKTEKFALSILEDVTPPNEWLKFLTLQTHDQEYVSLSVEVYQEFPPDAVIRTNVTFAGELIIQHEMTVCDSFEEELFGSDVIHCGFPQPGFPQHCPFGPHKFIEVKDWKFPHYKIPDGTPPGSVLVNITFSSEDIIMLKINAEGEVVQDLYSMDGPKRPALG